MQQRIELANGSLKVVSEDPAVFDTAAPIWLEGQATPRIDDDAFTAFAVQRSGSGRSAMLLILDWRGRVVARERDAVAAGMTLASLVEHVLADPPQPPDARLAMRSVRWRDRAVGFEPVGSDFVASERRLASLGAALLPTTVLDIDPNMRLHRLDLELTRIVLLTGVPLSAPASLAQRIWLIARRISNGDHQHRIDAATLLEPLVEFGPDLYGALRPNSGSRP